MKLLDTIKEIGRTIVPTAKDFAADGAPSMAAAIAYYTVFSLPPLLVLIVRLAGLLFDPADVRESVLTHAGGMVGMEGAEQMGEMIAEGGRRSAEGGLAGLLGVLALLVGATGAFIELQRALNIAWGVRPDPAVGGIRNFVTKRILSLSMVLGLAFLLLTSLVISAAIAALGSWLGGLMPGVAAPLLGALDFILSLTLIGFLIAALFRYLPDAKVAWRDVGVGAVITTLLFLLGKFLIGFYLGRGEVGSVFGAAGSLAIILVWIYYTAMILLFGAEFTQIWTQRHGRAIEPEEGAMLVETVERRERPKATRR